MPDSKTGDRSFRNQSAEYRDAGIGALGIEALAVRRSSRVLRLVRPRSTFCSDDTVYGTGEEDEGSGGTDEREHYAGSPIPLEVTVAAEAPTTTAAVVHGAHRSPFRPRTGGLTRR